MRQDVDWSNIKNQADFIRAIDIQTPVLFDGYQAPTNIYADYIYDSKGKMRWIYADGKATKVDLTETGNSPQNFLVEVARLQYQMVFVIKSWSYHFSRSNIFCFFVCFFGDDWWKQIFDHDRLIAFKVVS